MKILGFFWFLVWHSPLITWQSSKNMANSGCPANKLIFANIPEIVEGNMKPGNRKPQKVPHGLRSVYMYTYDIWHMSYDIWLDTWHTYVYIYIDVYIQSSFLVSWFQFAQKMSKTIFPALVSYMNEVSFFDFSLKPSKWHLHIAGLVFAKGTERSSVGVLPLLLRARWTC